MDLELGLVDASEAGILYDELAERQRQQVKEVDVQETAPEIAGGASKMKTPRPESTTATRKQHLKLMKAVLLRGCFRLVTCS